MGSIDETYSHTKGLGRAKEFSGKEGFFTSGRRRRRRSLRVFEWCAEQATEISAAAIDLEFLPKELALQLAAQSTHDSHEL